MGEDPVLLCRGADGTIRAFLNMCRHRGNRVCRADQGNATSFMCTYHGWCYSNDGKLIGVPGMKEIYSGELDMKQWGLVEVAQLDIHRGLIFATFDPKAPPLLEYLGGQEQELGGHVRPARRRHRDHRRRAQVGDERQLEVRRRQLLRRRRPPHHHAHVGARRAGGRPVLPPHQRGTPPLPPPTSGSRELPEASSGTTCSIHFDETVERIGRDRAQQAGLVTTVFPNVSPNFIRHMIRVWHPRGPDKTEIWSYCVVDKEAPPEVKTAMRRHLTQTFGPSGNLEQDDMNNWEQCTGTARGVIARRYPQNIQAHLGHEEKSGAFGGGKRLRDSTHAGP